MKQVIFYLLAILSISHSAASTNLQESNTETVLRFYELAFNKHRPTDAMKLYVAEKYKQHNPFAGDGKQPFIDFFTKYYSENPAAYVEVKRTIAEGDLVVVHVHSKKDKKDRGSAVVDIFRLKNGKIAEHWDVVQSIPETAANTNSMF